MAMGQSGDPVELRLQDGESTVASLVLPIGAAAAGFEDVAAGFYSLKIDDPRFEVVGAPAEPGRTARLELRGNARLALTLRGDGDLGDVVIEANGIKPQLTYVHLHYDHDR